MYVGLIEPQQANQPIYQQRMAIKFIGKAKQWGFCKIELRLFIESFTKHESYDSTFMQAKSCSAGPTRPTQF